MGGDEGLEVLDEGGETLRRHGGVLDERGRPFGAGRAHEQRQGGAAQGAGLCQRGRLGEVGDLHGSEVGDERAQARETLVRLVLLALVLDGEHAPARRPQERRHARVGGELGRRAQRHQIEQLDRGRPGGEDGHVGVERGAQGGEGERGADPQPGPRSSATSSSANSASVPSEPARSRAGFGAGASSSRRL